ncbi:Mce family protein [Gordonia rubripertincta]|uniref:Mce family protein n=1 Tax=Gordonia rubripertincta TaxID=36822 RepID=UPI000E5A72D7|nr:Mce family protein [Gordonia rubripertincta]
MLAIGVVVVVALTVMVIDRARGDDSTIAVRIETPYVAPGVKDGSDVILNGAEVGTIERIRRSGSDSVTLDVALEPSKIVGLTDSFEMDFRPQNYFGVTALNLVKGPGGSALRNGVELTRSEAPNYSMSTMIERGSIVTDGVLSEEMVATLDEVLRYTNGLTPMLQTGLILADQIAKTQRALPSELIGQANEILDVLPAFLGQTIDGGYTIYQGKYNRQPDGSFGVDTNTLDRASAGLDVASGALFSAVGKLLSSHATELTPAVEIVKLYADVVPGMVSLGATGPRLRAVVERLAAAFGGTPERPSLRLRLLLSDLPALAAPLALGGLVQQGGAR